MNNSNRSRGINYRLCTAIDLTKLGMVLDEMKSAGLSPLEQQHYMQMASAMLAILRTANYRLHEQPPVAVL